jgi:hypothetical protein
MQMSFSWSFSKLQAVETCPKQYNERKNYPEGDRSALDWGDQVHKAFAQAFIRDEPLPSAMAPWQHWIDENKALPGSTIIEAKWALDRDFNKVNWSAPTAWYRGKADFTRVDDVVADGIDWKTGRVKEDETQLLLMAQLVFAHFPKVRRCRQRFVWLKENCATERVYSRADMAEQWLGILDRVKSLEEMEATNKFPPKPGKLCREWCPVKACEFYGKSFH